MSDLAANLSRTDGSSPEARDAPNSESSAADEISNLVAACQRNEREAQREVFERFHLRVHRLAVRMVGAYDAPDLTQQIFLHVFQRINQFAGKSQFTTWLYRVAANECLQHLRRAKSKSGSLRAMGREPIEPRLAHTERIEQQDLMETALGRLEPDLRAIFLLREVDGQNYAELAETFELSEGTVASRLNRARSQLKQHLVDLGWEP